MQLTMTIYSQMLNIKVKVESKKVLLNQLLHSYTLFYKMFMQTATFHYIPVTYKLQAISFTNMKCV